MILFVLGIIVGYLIPGILIALTLINSEKKRYKMNISDNVAMFCLFIIFWPIGLYEILKNYD